MRSRFGLICAWVLGLPSVLHAQPQAEAPGAAQAASDDITLNPYFDTRLAAGTQRKAPPRASSSQDQASATPRAATSDTVADQRARVLGSWDGPTGGVHLVDAGTGLPGSVRLHFAFDYFRNSDFLFVGDTNESVGGTLALSVTVHDLVEVFASLRNRGNSNNAGDPVLLQAVGEGLFGAKVHTELLPWLALGADLRLAFANTVGDLGLVLGGTSVGLRAALTADLRRIEEPLPLLLRANLDYYFDNTGALIEDTEDSRLASLGVTAPADESRHLVTRIERFAFDINRVDMLTLGLGVEAPLEAARDFYVHPLLEWRLGIPVNRQAYSCLLVPTDASAAAPDGCLAEEGLAAAPSTLTLGVRALPPVRGLSAFLGLDIGLLGTGTFVRELAPNRSWALLAMLGYAPDPRPAPGEVRVVYVPARAAHKPEEPAGVRVQGAVIEAGANVGIANAVVRYRDRMMSPQLTNDDGRFVSYELPAGEAAFEISHPDYEPRTCTLAIPASQSAAPRADAQPASGLSPVGAESPDGEALALAPAPPASKAPTRTLLELRCELVARPRAGNLVGILRDDQGAPIAGATLTLEGPTQGSAQSDAGGSFAFTSLSAGNYTVRADAQGYLLASQPVEVGAGMDAQLGLTLAKKPSSSQVVMTTREVKIRKQIMFKPNSAEIDERSTGLLTEIADVLLRNPQVRSVQIQGHTDNRGEPAANVELSQRRAESVMQWLVERGVSPERMNAKGYGDARPLVPNLTNSNRARNRRVQFMIEP